MAVGHSGGKAGSGLIAVAPQMNGRHPAWLLGQAKLGRMRLPSQILLLKLGRPQLLKLLHMLPRHHVFAGGDVLVELGAIPYAWDNCCDFRICQNESQCSHSHCGLSVRNKLDLLQKRCTFADDFGGPITPMSE